MRAAFYGRFSSDHQRESSIADQLRNVEKYAARAGWKIGKKYDDKVISGSWTSPTLREELASLEAERERHQGTLKLDTRQVDKVIQLVPNLTKRYRAIVEDLEEVTVRGPRAA